MNKCECGSKKFTTSMTLEISNVPVTLKGDGSVPYDDTKGTSEGWDIIAQPEIECARCHHIYRLEQQEKETKDGRPTYRLKDMQPKKRCK
jgi:hypothetical protein